MANKEIEFDEMSGEEMRVRERQFTKFKEKYLRCERCGSFDVAIRLGSQGSGNFNERYRQVPPTRLCKKCGLVMKPIPQDIKLGNGQKEKSK